MPSPNAIADAPVRRRSSKELKFSTTLGILWSADALPLNVFLPEQSIARSYTMIVGVCDTDPVTAGLVAHYLSVALNVLARTEGIDARVGVLEPFTLTDPSQIGAIGEAPSFAVIDASVNVTAYVSLNGFGSSQVEQRIARDGIANVCLTEYLVDRDDDTVALADACIRVARDLAKRFSAL